MVCKNKFKRKLGFLIILRVECKILLFPPFAERTFLGSYLNLSESFRSYERAPGQPAILTWLLWSAAAVLEGRPLFNSLQGTLQNMGRDFYTAVSENDEGPSNFFRQKLSPTDTHCRASRPTFEKAIISQNLTQTADFEPHVLSCFLVTLLLES